LAERDKLRGPQPQQQVAETEEVKERINCTILHLLLNEFLGDDSTAERHHPSARDVHEAIRHLCAVAGGAGADEESARTAIQRTARERSRSRERGRRSR